MVDVITSFPLLANSLSSILTLSPDGRQPRLHLHSPSQRLPNPYLHSPRHARYVHRRNNVTIGTIPSHLTDRVSLTTHDFFTPQIVTAEIYFFRMIFHGFADKYRVRILQALRPALKTGAKVVINDGALPEPLTAGYVEERSMRTMDLLLQVTVNAREREADDWRGLFAKADERYRFDRIWKPR